MVYLFLLGAYLIIWRVSIGLYRALGSFSLWDNPYSWFVPVWIIQAILLLAPLLDFATPVSAVTGAYILACHLAFASGAFFTFALSSRVRSTVPMPGYRAIIVFVTLSVGLASEALLLFDNIASTGVGVADRFGSSQALSDFREARLNGSTVAVGFLGPAFGLITILSTLSLIGVAYLGFSWGVRDEWASFRRPSGLLGLMAMVMSCFLSVASSGGRIDLVFVAALNLLPFALGRSLANPFGTPARRQVKRLLIAAPIIIALFMGSASYQSFRGVDRPPEQDLYGAWRAEMSPALREASAENNAIGYYLIQIGYISHSPTVLEFFHRFGTPGPFYGRYNFPNEMRLILRLMPNYDPDFWTHDRQYMFRLLESQGRLGNVWGTMIHDFEADFGTIGCVVAFFVFGIFIQSRTNSFYRRPTANRAALVGLLRLICLWSALSSLLFLTEIGWLLFALLLIEIPASMFRPRRRRGPANYEDKLDLEEGPKAVA